MRSTLFDRARRHVEQQMKALESEQRRNLIRKRLECVSSGVRAYEAKRVGEAVLNYEGFLRLTEEDKGVGQGALAPSHFDSKKEMGDLLLVAGVYWELTKLFDRTKSEGKKQDFLHYLQKFVLFSKGTPFESLCAESIRRYISNGKAMHKAEFKSAYKVLGDGKCFVVTSLMDVTAFETLPKLWRFRDEVLARSLLGRFAIAVYYRTGPAIALILDRMPACVRIRCGEFIDRIGRWVSPD